jgi:hypothetical protein
VETGPVRGSLKGARPGCARSRFNLPDRYRYVTEGGCCAHRRGRTDFWKRLFDPRRPLCLLAEKIGYRQPRDGENIDDRKDSDSIHDNQYYEPCGLVTSGRMPKRQSFPKTFPQDKERQRGRERVKARWCPEAGPSSNGKHRINILRPIPKVCGNRYRRVGLIEIRPPLYDGDILKGIIHGERDAQSRTRKRSPEPSLLQGIFQPFSALLQLPLECF